MDDKANGKGITFSVQDGIPYMSYVINEDSEIDVMVASIFDDDPTNDVESDTNIDKMISNIYDDDPTNDAEPDPEIDGMVNNMFNT